MTTIQPGDLVELGCPDPAARPSVTVGQKVPDAAPSFLVMTLKDNSLTLGPLKAGDFVFDIACTQGAPIHAELRLVALKEQELPKQAPPAGLLMLTYPLWFWLALAIIALTLAGVCLGLYKQYSARFKKPTASEGTAAPTPEQIYLEFLQSCRREKLANRDDINSAEFLYSKGQETLRRYLEYRLGFRASWASSSEFVSQFRNASLSYKDLPATVPTVESLLAQADGVRFSKSAPDPSTREAFIRGLESMIKSINKALQVPT